MTKVSTMEDILAKQNSQEETSKDNKTETKKTK